MCIELFLDTRGQFLDHGAGYGLFVRLMRDLGYDFLWSDQYCQNLFARGFEDSQPNRYEAITAFELFEHLTNPLADLGPVFDRSECLIVSTTLVPEPALPLGQWWYYGLEHGQHVAFYTVESMRRIAHQFGRQVFNLGSLHVFTSDCSVGRKLRRVDNFLWQQWIEATRRREPLTRLDFETLVNRTVASQVKLTSS